MIDERTSRIRLEDDVAEDGSGSCAPLQAQSREARASRGRSRRLGGGRLTSSAARCGGRQAGIPSMLLLLASSITGLVAASPCGLAGEPEAAPSPAARSIAHLRAARSLAARGQPEEAAAEIEKVLAVPGAPSHLRLEAEECRRELERARAGLPLRDRADHRAKRPALPSPAVELHVAPSGSDSAPGTAERPFATLQRARDEIRAIRRRGVLPPGGAQVTVHGGEYRVERTLRLDSGDGGTEAAPVVYRAAPGARPRLRAGVRIEGFRPVEDAAVLARLPAEARGKVLQADLRASGVKEVPPLRLGGFASGAGFRTWPVVELFFGGKALPLAGWPDEGFVKVTEVTGGDAHQIHGIRGSKEGRFRFASDRLRRWEDAADVWLYGYWFWDWADSYERVASIDPDRQEIVLSPPYHNYGYRAGQRFRAINVLCEIDKPGEWYIDRERLILYVWPPSDRESGVFELSQGDFPMVEIADASHLAVVGLALELGGADGIILRGGERCL
ncbi:MAG: hypothetical protein JXA90_00525, partial [Planctomycetes bacterium]|nr:hypothetical protein [Planctomycetota bacterium]